MFDKELVSDSLHNIEDAPTNATSNPRNDKRPKRYITFSHLPAYIRYEYAIPVDKDY